MQSIINIPEIIPHRYPFLLVDKIVELVPGEKAVGIKNVTANEQFFRGHFPGYPIMPGVLILEALAQTAGIAFSSKEGEKGKLGVFAGIDGVKFKKQVVPGDTLYLEAEILLNKLSVVKARVRATVDGQVACEGEIKFAMVIGKS